MISISLAPSGQFILTIPSANGAGPHEVLVPQNLGGLSILNKVLSAEAKADQAAKRIGHDASPTQAQVNAWLTEDRRQRAIASDEERKQKAEANSAATKSLLEGISLEDLDI